MLNKEEIEERISYAKSNFTDGIEIFLEIIEKQQKCLEQKESILNKVTDKLKEDIDFLEFCRDRDMDSGYGEDEEDRAVRVYIESILNIIEGEKK